MERIFKIKSEGERPLLDNYIQYYGKRLFRNDKENETFVES